MILRVIAEKQELDEKIAALTRFIQGDVCAKLHPAERARLAEQMIYMNGYSDVLRDRIAAFVNKKNYDHSTNTANAVDD